VFRRDLDAKTRGLAVGVLASTTCNNFIADLLFLSEVSHSLLVAGAPCVHPYLGKSALGLRRAASGLYFWGWGGAANGKCLCVQSQADPSGCSKRVSLLEPQRLGACWDLLRASGAWSSTYVM
jgi:hypothetical protein